MPFAETSFDIAGVHAKTFLVSNNSHLFRLAVSLGGTVSAWLS